MYVIMTYMMNDRNNERSESVDANQMTFGIEIETTIPADAPIIVGGHGHGREIPQVPGWKADCDPSIRAGYGRRACEFVSPIYRGADGLRQLLADVATIKGLGAEVNASCGLHVHVGFDRNNVELLKRLTSLVSNFEEAIYAATGTHNRERTGWCNRLSRYGSADQAIATASRQRYHVCNLASHHPTVEFRAFGASLNVHKIVGYVRMCVGIVERAMSVKRTTNWIAKPVAATSPIHRGGEGQTALTRLFYQLGWTKGRNAHTYGDLSGQDLPEIKQSKRELMRLARKYDGNQPAAQI
jgi:hypothetical protein